MTTPAFDVLGTPGRRRAPEFADAEHMTQVNVRMPRELHSQFRLMAAVQDSSLSTLIDQADEAFAKASPWRNGFEIERPRALPSRQNKGQGAENWMLAAAYVGVNHKAAMLQHCEVLQHDFAGTISLASYLYNACRWYARDNTPAVRQRRRG